MSIAAWLDARVPAPPAALRARIDAALGEAARDEETLITARCLAAAERMLGALESLPARGRAAAIDLLAADALVTYAFEAAAEAPAQLEARTAEAMRRLARLATG